MAVAHKDRAHSRLGPSSAHRYFHCAASVSRSMNEPNVSTFFTREGTAAHELCEHILNTGEDPWDYVGGIVDIAPLAGTSGIHKPNVSNYAPDEQNLWLIDEEMANSVSLYRDTVMGLIQPGDIVELECRLDMRFVHPDLFGTGDALIFRPSTGELFVVDFKYGSGVAVDAESNEQLLTYAVGARHKFGGNVSSITLVIVQPRAFHVKGEVRTCLVSPEALDAFEERLRAAAALTDDPDAPAVPGEQCRFCRASHKCPELHQHVVLTLGVRFAKIPKENDMPALERMSAEHKARILREIVIIEAWMRRFKEHAHAEAMDGRILPGFKIVYKRAYRHFVDVDSVQQKLEALDFPPSKFMKSLTPELMSVAQIETSLGKKTFKALLSPDVTKNRPGFVLALKEDHREEVKLRVSHAFGAADE